MSAPSNRKAIGRSPALLGRGGVHRQAIPGLTMDASASCLARVCARLIHLVLRCSAQPDGEERQQRRSAKQNREGRNALLLLHRADGSGRRCMLALQMFIRRARYSLLGILCLLCAAISTACATASFQDSDAYGLTISRYLLAPLAWLYRLNPFRSSPPASPIVQASPILDLSESMLMFGFLFIAAASTVLTIIFGLRARVRGEPSQLWAAPMVFSMLIGFQCVQMLYWISQRS